MLVSLGLSILPNSQKVQLPVPSSPTSIQRPQSTALVEKLGQVKAWKEGNSLSLKHKVTTVLNQCGRGY